MKFNIGILETGQQKKVYLGTFITQKYTKRPSGIAWNKMKNEKWLPHQTGELLKPENDTQARSGRLEIFKERKQNLCSFVESLTKIESHCCQTDCQIEKKSRMVFQCSIIYSKWCHVFDDMNLNHLAPKKYECFVVLQTGNLNKAGYQLHQSQKVESMKRGKG